ncbi:MAG: cytochrome c biogenesis protein CcsA [Coriobacteriia bacterium]|nr:cytochrome c biogenesis protein CcsA [Coriobacteriia bacterium]
MKQLRIGLVLLVIGGILTTAAFFMAFTTAEMQRFGTVTFPERIQTAYPLLNETDAGFVYERPWFSQKIFYFHVPVAEASFLVFGVAAFFAIRFLITKRREYDTKGRVAMETTLMFVLLTMITGVLWTKASWGVWWEWEPRLTTYFIMMLLIIAYFVLRNSIEDEERRAVYSAVFAIIAFIDAPISFFITRLIPSNHPVVFESGFATSNLLPFIIAQVGMLMVGYAIYVIRMSEERLSERVDMLKDSLEG